MRGRCEVRTFYEARGKKQRSDDTEKEVRIRSESKRRHSTQEKKSYTKMVGKMISDRRVRVCLSPVHLCPTAQC